MYVVRALLFLVHLEYNVINVPLLCGLFAGNGGDVCGPFFEQNASIENRPVRRSFRNDHSQKHPNKDGFFVHTVFFQTGVSVFWADLVHRAYIFLERHFEPQSVRALAGLFDENAIRMEPAKHLAPQQGNFVSKSVLHNVDKADHSN